MLAVLLGLACLASHALEHQDSSSSSDSRLSQEHGCPRDGESTCGTAAEDPTHQWEAASLLQVPARNGEGSHNHHDRHYHYALYVPLPDNHKHSTALYASVLERLCSWSRNQDMDEETKVVRVVGDLRAIEELAPSCKDMTHGASFTLRDLDYNDVVAELPEEGSKTCTLKFLGPELQHDLVKIWLNKVVVLCKLASEHPDAVTTLSDVNSNGNQLSWATEVGWRELQYGCLGTRQYKSREGRRFSWFSNEQCQGDVTTWAKYMAIRGRDCPRLLEAWEEELDKIRQFPRTCPCFDEEWILSELRERRPELFHLQGDPVLLEEEVDSFPGTLLQELLQE